MREMPRFQLLLNLEEYSPDLVGSHAASVENLRIKSRDRDYQSREELISDDIS